MIRHIALAALVSATMLAGVASANAGITASDCSYARSIADQRGHGGGDYSYNAHLIQSCTERGL